MLTILDEYTRECHVLRADRALKSADVLEWMGKAIAEHGAPEHLRSDNGPEFIAKDVQRWLAVNEIKTDVTQLFGSEGRAVDRMIACYIGECGSMLNGNIQSGAKHVQYGVVLADATTLLRIVLGGIRAGEWCARGGSNRCPAGW
jgi:hypothetical protein